MWLRIFTRLRSHISDRRPGAFVADGAQGGGLKRIEVKTCGGGRRDEGTREAGKQEGGGMEGWREERGGEAKENSF